MTQDPNALRREPDNGPAMHKERETKDDGRYIIFYTFDDDSEQEGQS